MQRLAEHAGSGVPWREAQQPPRCSIRNSREMEKKRAAEKSAWHVAARKTAGAGTPPPATKD